MRRLYTTFFVALTALWACERVDLNDAGPVGDTAETSGSGEPPKPLDEQVSEQFAASGSGEHFEGDGHDHGAPATGDATPPPTGPPPVLSFETLTHDFGRLYQGEKKTHTYNFKNEGEGDLVIKDVRPTCGCTVGDVSLKYLRPGEAATIDIQFDSTKFSGKVTKYIKVFSNDPQKQVVDLTFTADITRLFTTEPPIVNFLDVFKGETPSQSVTITATDGNDFKVLEVLPNSPFLDLKWEKIQNAGNPAIRVDVTVNDSSVVQNLVVRPVLRLEHPRAEEVTFAVRANIQPNLAFEPSGSRLNFGRIPKGQASEQVLTITNREADLHLEITDVKIESNLDLRTKLEDGTYRKYITADLEAVEDGQVYRIVVRASADIPDRYFHGRLTFTTNNPDVSSKVIAYHGFIIEPQQDQDRR